MRFLANAGISRKTGESLVSGGLVLIEDARYRVRRLPITKS